MSWRLAKSLVTLRDQVNKAHPNRSKASDGTIGDAKHSARKSDHNPNSAGVVCAIDLTHSPQTGFNSYTFAETLRQARDHRIGYVISNGRIFSSTTSPWVWRNYTGSNKHTQHAHVSVKQQSVHYDSTSPWKITATPPAGGGGAPGQPHPTLRRGDRGDEVRMVQRAVGAPVDGIFGPATEIAVKKYQTANGLTADGIVGPATWAKIDPPKLSMPQAGIAALPQEQEPELNLPGDPKDRCHWEDVTVDPSDANSGEDPPQT